MVKHLLQEMFILKEKGYFKQAIEILYKLLEMVESEEEAVEIIYELAEIYFFLGNIERAVHYVEKLLEINPNHSEALKLQIKLINQNAQQQMILAQNLYKLTNKSEDLKLYLALLNSAGKYTETVGYLNTSHEALCCHEIAEALFYLGRFEEAKSLLLRQDCLSESNELLFAKICYSINDEDSRKILETRYSATKNPEILGVLIKIEFELMNYSKVIEYGSKVNLFYYAELLYIVGQAYFFKKNIKEAKKCFNMLCDTVPAPKYYFALAMAYIVANQTSQAIEIVQKNTDYLKLVTFILNEHSISKKVLGKEILSWIGLLKQDEFALFVVLELCFKRGLVSTITELLKYAYNKRNLRYDFYSIKHLIQENKLEEAESSVMQYRNYEAFAMIYAEILNEKCDFQTLEQLLSKRTSYEESEYEQCCFYYARIFEHKGQYERAIDIAEKGLDFIENYVERYYTLLYTLYKNIGDLRTALDCLEKAAKYNPELRPKLIREAAEL